MKAFEINAPYRYSRLNNIVINFHEHDRCVILPEECTWRKSSRSSRSRFICFETVKVWNCYDPVCETRKSSVPFHYFQIPADDFHVDANPNKINLCSRGGTLSTAHLYRVNSGKRLPFNRQCLLFAWPWHTFYRLTTRNFPLEKHPRRK